MITNIDEASHWVNKLTQKLMNNPSKINPTVQKFVDDKQRAHRVSQLNNTMKGGSVPSVRSKPKNPWDNGPKEVKTAGPNGGIMVGSSGLGTKGQTTKHQFRNESAMSHGWAYLHRKIAKHKKLLPKLESELQEKSPPGWKGTVEHMKKHKNISNPWALAWWQKNKGYHSHK